VRALYPPPPAKLTDQDRYTMQALGLTENMLAKPDVPGDIDVWPDLVGAFELFLALQTQWRTGFNGPTGLDYAAVPAVAHMLGIARATLRELWTDLQAMERAALELFAERRA
jgi:hypothetical protein